MNDMVLQAQLNVLHNTEKQAVQSLLTTALQHGFQLAELTRLAEKYHTSVAVMEINNRNGDCIVNYANGSGYFTRQFGLHYGDASEFVEQFDTWWYQ
ncbi:hypothetical protein FDX19_01830 [Citrobacter sp. wls619]|uniref:hypothetical protein n=1 Tax=Citrobacter sp. wls619 TaxID=2576432 RepID=UPI0010C9580E|nr:hypothetical protein [Citrobacter sp. wls619]TKV13929.1 hypothetical protein FDX19_01830 [Citrobacter sp. wls619]